MWKVGVIWNEKGHMNPKGRVTNHIYLLLFPKHTKQNFYNFFLSLCVCLYIWVLFLKTTLIKCLPIGEIWNKWEREQANSQAAKEKKYVLCIAPFYKVKFFVVKQSRVREKKGFSQWNFNKRVKNMTLKTEVRRSKKW